MHSSTSGTPRKPRRLGRKLLVVLLGFIALVVVILALLPYVISLEGIKGQIVARAEAALQRKVEIGQVRLQILSGLGAGLKQLTVYNSPGWQQPHFVKVDTLSVKVAFLPLLQRRIEISRLILSHGEITIERDAQGRLNYDDLTAAKPAPDTAPSTPTPEENPLAALLVSKVSLQDVNVTFFDRMAIPGQTVTTQARDVNVDIENIALNRPIDFDIAMAVLTDGDRNVRLRGRVGPIPDSLAFEGVPIQASLQAEQLDLARLAPYMGPEAPLTAGRLQVNVDVQGSQAGGVALDGSLSLADGVMRDAKGKGQPIQLPTVSLTQKLSVDLAQALLTLTTLRLDLDPLQATLKGTVHDFKTVPRVDLQLATNEFAVAKLLANLPMLATALPASTDLQGNLQLQAALKGTPSQLQSTSTLNMQQVAMTMTDGNRLTLPNVALVQDSMADLIQSVVQLREARLDLAPLQATLKGTVRNFRTTPQIDLQLATNEFAPGELLTQLPMLATLLPAPHTIEGRLQLRGTAKGSPQNLRADTQLTVPSLSVKSGSFSGAKQNGGMLFETTKTQAQLQTRLTTPGPPDVRLDLTADRLVFDQQAAPETAAKSPPPAQPEAKSSAPPINMQGKVSIAQGRIKQLAFENLTADLSLIEGLLKSKQTFTTFGGKFQGDITANLAKPEPDYTLAMKLASVKADSLVNELTSLDNVLFGNLTTDVNLAGQGFTWPAISKTLTGKGAVQIANLKLTTLDLMPKLAPALQAVGQLAGFSVPQGLAERSFDSLQGAFQIDQGQMRTPGLTLRGKEVEVQAKGVLGLDQSLDFEGTALLLGSLATGLGNRASFLQDKEGRVAIPFTVRGTVTNPQIAPNEAYLMDLAKQALAKQVEEKAGQGIQKLLEKTPLRQDSQPAPPGAGGKKQEPPEEAIKDTLKGLFKKR